MHDDSNILHRSPVINLGPVRDKKKRLKWYLLMLVVTKLTITLSIFLCYDTLQSFNAVIYLFIAKLLTSIILMLIHKPITSGKQLTVLDYKNVFVYSLFSIVLSLVWLEALIICGPVRTILLSYQSEVIFVVLLNLMFKTEENLLPSSSRGCLFYLIGLLCLLFFDQDEHGEHYQQGKRNRLSIYINHHFGEAFTWLGLPGQKGGLLLLLLISFVKLFINNYGKKLSSDIGGNKRLKALSSLIELFILLPVTVLVSTFATRSLNIWSKLPVVIFISIVIYIFDFYVESVSIANFHKYLTHRWGSIASFMMAIIIGLIWEHTDGNHSKHGISIAVLFGTFFFISATILLVQVPPINPPSGKLIGYATNGKPIYTFADKDGVIPKSVFKKCQQYMRIIWESTDSRNIFLYLCINLVFTGVELLYGMWTNSLGLISDGFHMLFDCSALVLGLWASLASKWSANKTFSFGYGRVEVLSGFVNGLFLVVIAFVVFTTAIQRIYDPPMVSTEKLLVVSIAGLFVNLLGITVFSHAHSHGGGACGQELLSHGHSQENHNTHSHSHSHGGSHSHKKKQGSSNMQGVFLHVLADTFGSIGVILSTLLIQYFGWLIADPICSLFISALIFLSVIPLLKESAAILLQSTPKDMKNDLNESLYKIKDIQGVLSYREFHVWKHTSAKKIGSIIVQVKNEVSEQRIRQQVVSLFKEYGISKLNIQVEKETFHDHMTKLTTGYYNTMKFPESSTRYLLSSNDIAVRIKEI